MGNKNAKRRKIDLSDPKIPNFLRLVLKERTSDLHYSYALALIKLRKNNVTRLSKIPKG